MVPRQAAPPAAAEGLELLGRPAVCPSISVANASSSDVSTRTSPSPAPSQHSTSRASTPGSRQAQSPYTPASSVYDPSETVDRAYQPSESIEGSTRAPSGINSTNTNSSALASPTSVASSWKFRARLKRLVPGNGTQQILGLGVCALTIVTVVYSHRADRNQRWENGLNFYQACEANNYTLRGCDNYRGVDLEEPPYDPWKMFIWNDKRALGHSPRSEQSMPNITDHLVLEDTALVPAAQEQFSTLAGILVLALAMLASAIYIAVEKRRSTQIKVSDYSMARSEFSQPVQPTTPHATGVGANGESTGGRRFRAYVTAETAIKRLKAVGNNSSTGRKGSMPWRSDGLDPSLFEDAVLYHEGSEGDDADTAIWERIKQHRDSHSTLSEAASTLYSPKLDSNRPSNTTPGSRSRFQEDEKLQQLHPVRRWLMPKRIVVSNQPLPELHEGDMKGAIALMGAATAATGGGTAMSMCPVEVPISSHHLPEGWMPISPQDTSSAGD